MAQTVVCWCVCRARRGGLGGGLKSDGVVKSQIYQSVQGKSSGRDIYHLDSPFTLTVLIPSQRE